MKLIILIATLLVGSNVYAFTVTLQWDPNTESNLAGYHLHYGHYSRNYPWRENVVLGNCNRAVCRHTLEIPAGRWYFAVTAYNTNRNESGYSNEASALIGGIPSPWLNLLLDKN